MFRMVDQITSYCALSLVLILRSWVHKLFLSLSHPFNINLSLLQAILYLGYPTPSTPCHFFSRRPFSTDSGYKHTYTLAHKPEKAGCISRLLANALFSVCLQSRRKFRLHLCYVRCTCNPTDDRRCTLGRARCRAVLCWLLALSDVGYDPGVRPRMGSELHELRPTMRRAVTTTHGRVTDDDDFDNIRGNGAG